jgi:hypothetical protein
VLRSWARAAWVLVAFIVIGLVVPVSTPTVAAAATTCPTMEVVGVRGSGETVNDYNGYGRTIADIVDHIKSIVPSVESHEVDYQAIVVGYGGITYPWKYKKSVASGTTALTTYITNYLKGPCGKTTYLYLAGYSQGAQVVGDVFQALTSGARARIAGTVMMADPRFNGLQAGQIDVGTFSHNRDGVDTYFGVASTRVLSSTARVRSYCTAYDPICNWTASNGAGCKIDPSGCVHVHYADLTDVSGLTYTVEAANYLIGRWRVVGPKPPVIGPKSKVLIYGDGDATEDASGTQNLVSALTLRGFAVTTSATLPTDLSPYGQVWHYGADVPSTDEQTALVNFARSGGSLYLTGEWDGCCGSTTINSAVQNIFNQLVVTVGGFTVGPDGSDVVSVNRSAVAGAAANPNALSTLQGRATGTIDMFNQSPAAALFSDGGSYATAALWDDSEVVGGGRLAIVMDVNWAQTGYGDMTTMPLNAQNIAYFLSGSAFATAQLSNHAVPLGGGFVPAPATPRVGAGSGAAGAH